MKKKKSLVLWADDDWMNFSKGEHMNQLVFGKGDTLGCFHFLKKNCYEGEARKVRITIEEI